MDKRIESYLDSVIPEKLSKRRQKLIREELRDHISDHIDFYTEIGYSEDESIQKALADMGDDGGVTAMVKKDFEKVYGEKNLDADFGIRADNTCDIYGCVVRNICHYGRVKGQPAGV